MKKKRLLLPKSDLQKSQIIKNETKTKKTTKSPKKNSLSILPTNSSTSIHPTILNTIKNQKEIQLLSQANKCNYITRVLPPSTKNS